MSSGFASTFDGHGGNTCPFFMAGKGAWEFVEGGRMKKASLGEGVKGRKGFKIIAQSVKNM